jgi:hypothetical protein
MGNLLYYGKHNKCFLRGQVFWLLSPLILFVAAFWTLSFSLDLLAGNVNWAYCPTRTSDSNSDTSFFCSGTSVFLLPDSAE